MVFSYRHAWGINEEFVSKLVKPDYFFIETKEGVELWKRKEVKS